MAKKNTKSSVIIDKSTESEKDAEDDSGTAADEAKYRFAQKLKFNTETRTIFF